MGRLTPTWMLGHSHLGQALGIIGMGRIGQAVARRARAFGLQIHYHNRKKVVAGTEEELEATYWESLRPDARPHGPSSRSTARIRPRPIICSRRAGSS